MKSQLVSNSSQGEKKPISDEKILASASKNEEIDLTFLSISFDDDFSLLELNIRKYLTQESLEFLAKQADLPAPPMPIQGALIKRITLLIDMLKYELDMNVDLIRHIQDGMLVDKELKWCLSIIYTFPSNFPGLAYRIPNLGLICETISKILNNPSQEVKLVNPVHVSSTIFNRGTVTENTNQPEAASDKNTKVNVESKNDFPSAPGGPSM